MAETRNAEATESDKKPANPTQSRIEELQRQLAERFAAEERDPPAEGEEPKEEVVEVGAMPAETPAFRFRCRRTSKRWT